ncbi:MAG: hypothetical protein EA390_08415 [Balneolaceae bacterium]|nr:MAG: hypothetical protein EA390_08415 [Balneolaceae bacterium]
MKPFKTASLLLTVIFLTLTSIPVYGQVCPEPRDDAFNTVERILNHPQYERIQNETGLQITSIEEVSPVANESTCQQLQLMLRVNGGDLGPQLTRTDLIPFFYKSDNRYFISYKSENEPGMDPETGYYRVVSGWTVFYVLNNEFNVLGRYMI